MSKTLAESAAEILKASVSAATKEPGSALNGAPDDLGGATPTDDYSTKGQSGQGDEDTSVGMNVSKKVKPAAKPGNPNAFVEPIKLQKTKVDNPAEVGAQYEETEATGEELTEEEIDAYLESLSEEELAELAEEALDEMGTLPQPDNTVGSKPLVKPGQKVVKPVANPTMPGKTVKEMVEANMTSCLEDVDALFNGESLSEDFRTKATTIFEAAVKSRVENVVEQIVQQNAATIAEEVDAVRADLSEQVDTYLNYVVEEWMKENQVAVDSGLRSELAEDFINGLKNLFNEHYIEIPEEKIDVAESLATQVVDLESQVEAIAEEAAAIKAELNEAKKHEAIRKICEGLTEVQIGKMKSLAESVEFTSEGEFNNKLAVIRENYFPSKTVKVEEAKTDASVGGSEEVVEQVNGIMNYYVNAITKSLPK